MVRAANLAVCVALAFGAIVSAAAATSAAAPAPAAARRLEQVKVEGKAIDLHALPDNQVLRGKSGRQISGARLKQLHALLSGTANANAAVPTFKAQSGQSLKTLAAMPGNSRIQFDNGRMVRAQDLAKIVALTESLKQTRKPEPVPRALHGVTAKSAVGPSLSIEEALKRPGDEPIRVGKLVYSAQALREIDAKLRASPREPMGLAARATAVRNRTGAPPPRTSAGQQLRLAKGTSLKSVLDKPDNTVLVSPHGKTITVGQLKAHLNKTGQTVEQLQAQARKAAKKP